MTNEKPRSGNQLFMLRVWPEELASGQREWRGRIQYLPGGEVRYFHELPMLLQLLESLLHEAEGQPSPAEALSQE